MKFDIEVGSYKLGMVEKVEIIRSVEQLADTAVVTLPGAEYNIALDVEQKIHRGDRIVINLGYEEIGMVQEFEGYVQRIGSDNGAITLECEDDLFLFRKSLSDEQLKNVTLASLLQKVVDGVGGGFSIDCSYSWTYEKFVINSATGYDVLRKIQEECGADIYIQGKTLHVHAPGEKVGNTIYYDFTQNVQDCDLTYRRTEDRRVRVVVKALLPDGKTFVDQGIPYNPLAKPDPDTTLSASERQIGGLGIFLVKKVMDETSYEYKDGSYYVRAVTTEFSSDGGKRTVELGYRLT